MDWKETLIRDVFEKRPPTLLLGSGASISTGISLSLDTNFPSMADLAKRLFDEIVPAALLPDDSAVWEAFRATFDDLGTEWRQFNLEQFLTDHPLRTDSAFLRAMLTHTARAFEQPHRAVAKALESEHNRKYPLRTLLERLVRAAPVTHPEVRVVTPNYDLLVEFTADLIGAPCLTGFSGTIVRHWTPELGFAPVQLLQGGHSAPARRIRLIKPHGSYSWHQSRVDGRVIEHFGLRAPFGDWQPCMITPGPGKYAEALKDVRREHMRFMDDAFRQAQSLLIVGYGFNDPHLEAGIRQILNQGTPAVIITKDLGKAAIRTYVTPYPLVTCITSDGRNGSTIIQGSKQFAEPAECLWQLEQFVQTFFV